MGENPPRMEYVEEEAKAWPVKP